MPRAASAPATHSVGVLALSELYHIWYTEVSVKDSQGPKKGDGPSAANTAQPEKRVPAIFYPTDGNREPVRERPTTLPYPEHQKRIGEDTKTVACGWPIG